jgi:hypothetical protein
VPGELRGFCGMGEVEMVEGGAAAVGAGVVGALLTRTPDTLPAPLVARGGGASSSLVAPPEI